MASRNVPFLIIVVILISKESYGQKFSLGACPTIDPETIGLNDPPFSAPSYEFATLGGVDRHHWQCVEWRTTAIVANSQYTLTISGKKIGGSVSRTGTITLVGTVATNVLTGGLLIEYNSALRAPKKMMYYAIENNPIFSILYACENKAFGKIEDVVIITTNRAPPIDAAAGSVALLVGRLIPAPSTGSALLDDLKFIRQTGC